MAGFKKAKPEQASIKMGFYGLSGSGKTFTALLASEGLAQTTGKRIAFVDTERGTDFYAQTVKERQLHPEGFDFDALYTRSITEVIDAVKTLDQDIYGIVVIDSMTHIWEACRNAYSGKLNKAGQLPFHAWNNIKKPYKELMNLLLNSQMHVFICGRQGNEWEEDEDTGDMKKVGTKMKAEGETPYEPHILIHMEAIRNVKSGEGTVTAFVEKDRTGLLSGKVINNPNFESLIKPILPLLGGKQAVMEDAEKMDAERLAEDDMNKSEKSKNILKDMSAKIQLCEGPTELKKLGDTITPELKKQMTTEDVATLRERYLEAQGLMKV